MAITKKIVKPKKTTEKKVTTAKKAVAKIAKEPVVEHKAEEAKTTGRYVYAVGRRKTAIAQVRLFPGTTEEEAMVNKRPIREYFGTEALTIVALSPLKATGLETAFTVTVVVRGSGLHSQAGAIKLGIARALFKHDALLRPTLKAQGFLTRDARAVERKKPGLKKARRSPQWAKR
ncbi:MAG TPA: 30S ribosomal protein S9 [Patescibacteria group bacterium]|nr:30S ribosomal protein S9 [Patescibacteria group bacterium]